MVGQFSHIFLISLSVLWINSRLNIHMEFKLMKILNVKLMVNPMNYVDQLNIPTLIIDAENETLFDRTKNGVLLHNSIKDRLEAKYIAYPGGHYDPYKGDNQKAAFKEASDWLVKYLKSDL